MNSTLNFSTASADLLTQELDQIVLSALSPGDAVIMTFTVKNGDGVTQRDHWSTTYYADEEGKVTISSLARMWNSYILAEFLRQGALTPASVLGGIVVTIAYELEDETTGSCNRRMWYQRRKTGATLDNMKGFIPAIATVKKTRVGAKEPTCVISSANVGVKVNATYVKNGASSSTSDQSISYSAYNAYHGLWDVSPSVVAALIPAGAVLKEYEVKSAISGTVKSSVKYVMTTDHPHGKQLCWLNNYGCWETLLMAGAEDLKLEYSAEFALGGDDFTAYNVEAIESRTVHTGYVNNTILNQVRDLADSPLVFVNDGGTWKKVVVDAVALERRKPSNEAPVANVTYRLAEREY